MVKPLMFLILLSLVFLSGCSTDTGKVVETTKLTIPETPSGQSQVQAPENIEELHKEFEEFEKSQDENLSAEQNETQEVSTENMEEVPASAAGDETVPEEEASTQNESVQCPPCEDNNPCTKDSCSEETDYECKHDAIIPCCGNGECEETEDWSACEEDCECALDCGACEIPDSETCSCLPKTECVQDDCCPENCTYLEDSDCPRPSVVFSEIYYNPKGSDPDHEWLEIYNNGTVSVDITKLKFNEDEKNHTLKSITEDILEPESYAVIAENTTQFLEDYPEFTGLLFDTSWSSLSNAGEPLSIVVDKDGILDSVSYNSSWGGDSTGFSLEKIDINGQNTQENWNESIQDKGTPGYKNSIST